MVLKIVWQGSSEIFSGFSPSSFLLFFSKFSSAKLFNALVMICSVTLQLKVFGVLISSSNNQNRELGVRVPEV